jgi:hypothetical protein
MTIRHLTTIFAGILGAVLVLSSPATAQDQMGGIHHQSLASSAFLTHVPDSLAPRSSISAPKAEQKEYLNAWGMDILVSNGGFGLGAFYRREFTSDIAGFATFSISESKDDREVEQFDPVFQISYVPGKLNRFLVLPLLVGVQYRLFREDIVDNFRPFVNAGVGPTMVFASPFTDVITQPSGDIELRQVEFFKSLGRGRAHYTAGGFIGFGANFGAEKSAVFGVNFRYYFTYLFGSGLPSLYETSTGNVIGTKKDFGGFFITVNVGVAN